MNGAAGSVRVVRRGRATLVCAPSLPPDLVDAWLAPDPLLEGAPLAACPERADLRRFETAGGPVVAKRFAPKGWRALRTRLTGGRARRAFELGRAMAASGVPTPEPLAWCRRGARALLFTREASGVALWSPALAADANARRRLTEALADAVAALHAAGFRHRDLKAPNWRVEARADAPRARLLDLDGAARARTPLPTRTVVRDLGRLCASFESDAARAAGVTPDDWAALVERYRARARRPEPFERLVLASRAWAAHKRARNARHKRALA